MSQVIPECNWCSAAMVTCWYSILADLFFLILCIRGLRSLGTELRSRGPTVIGTSQREVTSDQTQYIVFHPGHAGEQVGNPIWDTRTSQRWPNFNIISSPQRVDCFVRPTFGDFRKGKHLSRLLLTRAPLKFVFPNWFFFLSDIYSVSLILKVFLLPIFCSFG